MWRSIATRCSSTKRLLLSLHNNNSHSHAREIHSLLQQQVTKKSSFSCYQSYKLYSQSSISEFDNDNHHHDSSTSSEDVEVGDEMRDTQMGFGVSKPQFDEKIESFDEKSDTQKGISERNETQMGNVDGDGDGDTQMMDLSGLSSFIQELVADSGVDGDGDGEVSSKGNVDDVEGLEKVLSLLQSSVDESLEGSLNGIGLSLSEGFMSRVVETPLVPGAHLIRFVKWGAKKMKDEVVVSNAVLGKLIGVIGSGELRRKDVYALWDLVKEFGEKVDGSGNEVVSADILNQLISLFSRMGKGKAAYEVFGKFEELGCVPNVDTYYLTIEALCKRSFYDWAVEVIEKMLHDGMLPEKEKVGKIISFLCKGRREKEAHKVFLAAKEKDMYPNQKPVNFLISCLTKENDTVSLAQQMLVDFPEKERKHAINPFSWVIRGLCRKQDVEGAKKLLAEMIEKGPPPGNAVFNTIINCLSKTGDLEDAKSILELNRSRGLKPDLYAYTVIMSGYAKGGAMEDAENVLLEARKDHKQLCPVTYHTLIRGYCKLEKFDEAIRLLTEMKNDGVRANVDEYNKLIQSLCLKALDWETAEKLLEKMKTEGMELPGITRGLIRAVKELDQEAAVSEDTLADA